MRAKRTTPPSRPHGRAKEEGRGRDRDQDQGSVLPVIIGINQYVQELYRRYEGPSTPIDKYQVQILKSKLAELWDERRQELANARRR